MSRDRPIVAVTSTNTTTSITTGVALDCVISILDGVLLHRVFPLLHLAHLGSGVLIGDLVHAVLPLAFDLLPEVRVRGEVDAPYRHDTEFQCENGHHNADAGNPPAEPGPERVEEGAADEIDGDLLGVDGRDERVPHKPGYDGEGEAEGRDPDLIVEFEDTVTVVSECLP